MHPTLIVVSGPPASGKTTLAHALAQAIHCPAICRDEIKEGLVGGTEPETFVPELGDAANQAATAVFFDVVHLMVQRSVTVVAEAAFQHHRWAPWITRWSEAANIRIVNCEADVAVTRQRRVRRWRDEPWRRRFHADPDLRQLARIEPRSSGPAYQPIHLEFPTLDVDTSDGYRPAFDEIVAFVQG